MKLTTNTLLTLLVAAQLTGDAAGQNNARGRRNDQTALERYLERNGEPQPGRTVSDANVQLGAKGGISDWEFPQGTDRWINSSPLTADSLAGKGVVLVFFEEECPACAAKWPDLMKLSAQYKERPVLFVAVNSGNDGRAVGAYARKQRISWPVIADHDRQFESTMGLSQISLDNVIQARYVTANGVAHNGKWSDLEGTAEAALEGATWKVEPPAPAKLQNAWMSIELGRYAEAAKTVRRYADEPKESQSKAFAEKLLAAVKKDIDTEYREAGVAFKEERFWDAYKALTAVEQRFKGYELPGGVEKGLDALEEREDVKSELKAKKSLDKAIRTASRGSEAAVNRGLGMLKRLVSGSPGTEAAGEAEKILAQYNR